jgi:hypothetical protein
MLHKGEKFMDYFSKKHRGGVITSKIENQDSVGVILALEMMQPESNYGKYFNSSENWKIAFECNNDLEFISKDSCIFIQVKSSKIGRSEFIKIIKDFSVNYKEHRKYFSNIFFKISVFEGFKGKLKSFPVKLKEYKNAQKIYAKQSIKDDILLNLLKDFNIKREFKEIIKRLSIDTRYLLKDKKDTKAIFAHNIRKTYFIRDIGDQLALNIYKKLVEEFANKRRTRGSISNQEILKMINNEIKNMELISELEVIGGYHKVSYGYKKNENIYLDKIISAQKKIKKSIFKNWRKAFLKEFLISMLIGHKKCPECNHPLNANLGGLKGIACPDCGFQPYITLFIGCYCGNYIAIKSQPNLKTEDIYNYILEYFETNDNLCEYCGEDYIDNFMSERIFLAPVPYPFDNFNLDELYL